MRFKIFLPNAIFQRTFTYYIWGKEPGGYKINHRLLPTPHLQTVQSRISARLILLVWILFIRYEHININFSFFWRSFPFNGVVLLLCYSPFLSNCLFLLNIQVDPCYFLCLLHVLTLLVSPQICWRLFYYFWKANL